MSNDSPVNVAIVDYGMGNLYNVQRACAAVGLHAYSSTSPTDVLAADGVILPGVGAMPDAMRALDAAGLGDALVEVIARGTPLFGICLGMQLLMREGQEFTIHQGLGVLPGTVVPFKTRTPEGQRQRVPHVGWAPIEQRALSWDGTPLATTQTNEYMYFVHSYHVVPDDKSFVAATSMYNGVEFCAAVSSGNVFGCQFHPERSGIAGLRIYREFSRLVMARALAVS